jgi:uncharacterized transporter YbjL
MLSRLRVQISEMHLTALLSLFLFFYGVTANSEGDFFKEVARGGEQTQVLSISFIFSFSPLNR